MATVLISTTGEVDGDIPSGSLPRATALLQEASDGGDDEAEMELDDALEHCTQRLPKNMRPPAEL